MAVTGALTLFGGPLVFAVHDVAGLALGGVLVWKLRRVARRAFAHRLGPLAALLVLGTLLTGVLWSSAVHPRAFGYKPLNLHGVLGAGRGAPGAAPHPPPAAPPRARSATARSTCTASSGRGWSPRSPPTCSRGRSRRAAATSPAASC